MYVSTTMQALEEILVRKDEEGIEKVIYFISKKLVDYETRYIRIEKMCYPIIFVTKKLRHYKLGSTTHMVTKMDPLRYLLSKPYLFGRATKWVILLKEFDLVFINQNSIK